MFLFWCSEPKAWVEQRTLLQRGVEFRNTAEARNVPTHYLPNYLPEKPCSTLMNQTWQCFGCIQLQSFRPLVSTLYLWSYKTKFLAFSATQPSSSYGFGLLKVACKRISKQFCKQGFSAVVTAHYAEAILEQGICTTRWNREATSFIRRMMSTKPSETPSCSAVVCGVIIDVGKCDGFRLLFFLNLMLFKS